MKWITGLEVLDDAEVNTQLEEFNKQSWKRDKRAFAKKCVDDDQEFKKRIEKGYPRGITPNARV